MNSDHFAISNNDDDNVIYTHKHVQGYTWAD